MADHHPDDAPPDDAPPDDDAADDAIHEAPPPGRTEMPAGSVEPAAIAEALRDHRSALRDRARRTVADWGFPPVDDTTIDDVVDRRLTEVTPGSDRFVIFAVAADWADRQLDSPEEWLDDEAHQLADTAIRQHLVTNWLWNDATVIDTVTGWIPHKLRQKNRPELSWEDCRKGVLERIARIHDSILHNWSRDKLNRYFVTLDQHGFPAWDDQRLPSFIAAYADDYAFDPFNPNRTKRRTGELYTKPVDPTERTDPDQFTGVSTPLGDRPGDHPLFAGAYDRTTEDLALAEPLAGELRCLLPAPPPGSPHEPELSPDEQHLLDQLDADILAFAIYGHTPDDIAERLTTSQRSLEPAVVTSRIVVRCGQHSCVAHGRNGSDELRNAVCNDHNAAALATAVIDHLSRWSEIADYARNKKWDAATFARLLAVRITKVQDAYIDANFTPENFTTTIDRMRKAIPALGPVFHTLLLTRGPDDVRATATGPAQCPCEKAAT